MAKGQPWWKRVLEILGIVKAIGDKTGVNKE